MSLRDLLISRIQHQGPLSVSDYMVECLLHPEFGYYTTRDPLGGAGDFVTAPEISQMFGEMIGLALAQAWLDQGRPNPFTLAELGPGRGSLMEDALRAAGRVPGFTDSAQVHLVELSPELRKAQESRLGVHRPTWVADVGELPEQPLFVIANEFFDTLPIRQFVRDGEGWRERQIGVKEGGLCFGLGAPAPQALLSARLEDTNDGELVEHCAPAGQIMNEISQRIAQHGGAGLIIDYGDWRSLGDTLQAVKDHKAVDPLDRPGEVDLTAHVDFEALAHAARDAGLRHSRVTPQGVFLERLGITERARKLAAPLSGTELETLIAAHRRLTHPEEMGNLFKVLGLFPAQGHPPPGLEP